MGDGFSVLVGKTLTEVYQIGDDRLRFVCDDGSAYELYHSQDCCETVVIDDVSGDLADLIGSPVLVAEERESSSDGSRPEDVPADASIGIESNTWTFYTLRTLNGTVDIRWHGNSNGYYSESVYFAQTAEPAHLSDKTQGK